MYERGEIGVGADGGADATMTSDGFACPSTPYPLAEEADFALTARAEVLMLEGGD